MHSLLPFSEISIVFVQNFKGMFNKTFSKVSVLCVLFQLTGNGRFGISVPVLLLKGSVSVF